MLSGYFFLCACIGGLRPKMEASKNLKLSSQDFFINSNSIYQTEKKILGQNLKNSEKVEKRKQASFSKRSPASTLDSRFFRKPEINAWNESKSRNDGSCKSSIFHDFTKLQPTSQKAKPKKVYQNRRKKAYKLGKIYLKATKKNTYFSVCNEKNHLKASLSCGILKAKGKARKANFFVQKMASRLVDLLLQSKFKRFHLVIRGYIPKKTKRIYIKALKAQKRKFRIRKFTRLLKAPHNGCRPRKARRK